MSHEFIKDWLPNLARQLALIPTAELEGHVNNLQLDIWLEERVGDLDAVRRGDLGDARRQLLIVRHLLAARKAIDEREKFVTRKPAGAAP